MIPYFLENYTLIISHDVVGKYMAGPGIRYFQLARVLSRELPVVLAIPNPVDISLEPENLYLFEYKLGNWDSLESITRKATSVLINGYQAGEFHQLDGIGVPIIIDGYDPVLAEWLSATREKPEEQDAHWKFQMRHLTHQYLIGDYYICASERQRDWWLGMLEANGRINPWNLRADPTLRNLVNVVPYGLPSEPPCRTHPVVRGIWPGINETDKLILWGGGLWPWLDPITAIHAIAEAWKYRKDIRLIFPGTRHPNPSMSDMPSHLEDARHLAEQLDLLDKGVFFGDWIPYQEWQNVLLESDLALSLHEEGGLESRWAFRTRVLDYIWVGLPIIATRGDVTSEIIDRYGIGEVVPSGDAANVSNSILNLLDTPREVFQKGFSQAQNTFSWGNVSKPLVSFCKDPHLAADKEILAEIGNPYYVDELNRVKKINKSFEDLIHAYEQRRIVRFLNWVNRLANQPSIK